MSSLYVDVGVYGGVPVEFACAEACALAERLNVTVHFKFNDVKCMAIPGGKAKDLIANWRAAASAPSNYPMASTHPRPSAETQEKNDG